MKATGIVRRIDDLGRVVIPGGDTPDDADRDVSLLLTSLTAEYRFSLALRSISERAGEST